MVLHYCKYSDRNSRTCLPPCLIEDNIQIPSNGPDGLWILPTEIKKYLSSQQLRNLYTNASNNVLEAYLQHLRRSNVLKVVFLKIQGSSSILLCRMVYSYHHFESLSYLHLPGSGLSKRRLIRTTRHGITSQKKTPPPKLRILKIMLEVCRSSKNQLHCLYIQQTTVRQESGY